MHQRPKGTARRNFNVNRSRLIAGEDFFEVAQAAETRSLGLERLQGGTSGKVMLLAEVGYLMLVKSFGDDLAWQKMTAQPAAISYTPPLGDLLRTNRATYRSTRQGYIAGPGSLSDAFEALLLLLRVSHAFFAEADLFSLTAFFCPEAELPWYNSCAAALSVSKGVISCTIVFVFLVI